MIKLNPIQYNKIWGYELWIASTHPNGCQEDFKCLTGGDYPLLVKIIQADDILSVQVHPNDEIAKRLEGPQVRGKTECWYVLHAEPEAQIVYGLKEDYTDEQLKNAVNTGTLESLLKFAEVHTGDFIYIPAGTVHAIGGGLRLLEIQQSSDITYRLYDWGRGRECHVEKAVMCIRKEPERTITAFPGWFDCPFFTLKETVIVKNKTSVTAEGKELFFCISGSGTINNEPFKTEEIAAVKPAETVTFSGYMRLMHIVPKKL